MSIVLFIKMLLCYFVAYYINQSISHLFTMKSVSCVLFFIFYIHRKKEKVPKRIYVLQIAAFWLCFTAFLAL